MLAAGVDVLSTLNVQHLESLNDRVDELTGVRVRETIPDAVLARADEIVMIDLTPEALLDRLRAGKIYPAERIDAALNNFFRIENLAALREVALRQVAEEIGHKRLSTAEPVNPDDQTIAADASRAVGERLLALVEPYPGAQRLVRRAWRSAQRLGADLDLLWVKPPGAKLTSDQDRSLGALRRLASVLGARLLVEESDNVALATAEVARRQRTTYILLGRSRPARGLARLRTPLPQRLMELLPGVDVRIVADRAMRRTRGPAMSIGVAIGLALLGIAIGAGIGFWLPPHGRLPFRERPRPVRRILLPFTGQAISRRAFEAAVRLAKAENAIIMPAFLARVPRQLPTRLRASRPMRQRHAAARGDRSTRQQPGHRGRLSHRPRTLLPRRAPPATRRRARRPRDRLRHRQST